MSRRWYHDVSAEWLKARQAVLTATDVAGLLPEYKRYLKAVSKDPSQADKIWPGFAAVWCQKHSDMLQDTGSAEAAARGHIMEPWAVDSWNKQVATTFHHWDDCIICREGIGFSPDAMTIPQLTGDALMTVTPDGKFIQSESSSMKYDCPKEIMEIKSYEPAGHMKAVTEDRMEHKELMQVAMAFAVLPELEVARILWFCPGAPVSMFSEKYGPDDLHDQCRWIREIMEVYEKQSHLCAMFSIDHCTLEAKCTEEEVYMDYIAQHSDNDVFMLK